MQKHNLCLVLILSCLLIFGGCGAQYRNAALTAQELSQKTYTESVDNLYAMTIKANMALAKTKLKADGANIDTEVNDLSQAIVNAAWLKENTVKANALSNQVWTYIKSRESYLEVLIRDLNTALKSSENNKQLVD